MGFTLNCQADILKAIRQEAKEKGTSQTQYINEILREVFSSPNILTSRGRLDELQMRSRLFRDDLMKEIPDLASKERRNPDQMLLHLIELGIGMTEGNTVSTHS